LLRNNTSNASVRWFKFWQKRSLGRAFAAPARTFLKDGASAEAGTFKKIAEDWIREYVDERGFAQKRKLCATSGPMCTLYGVQSCCSISSGLDVNNLLEEIAKKHGKNQADAVLRTIRGVMTWHAVENGTYNSPLVRLSRG
jgi:hypothetical protein